MSRTKKEHPADKDGLYRNVAKLHDEADKMIDAVKNSGDSHAPAMNAMTEAARASPWGFAHLTVIALGVLSVALIALAIWG